MDQETLGALLLLIIQIEYLNVIKITIMQIVAMV